MSWKNVDVWEQPKDEPIVDGVREIIRTTFQLDAPQLVSGVRYDEGAAAEHAFAEQLVTNMEVV